MKIGVISDTHNYFDPALPKIFAGVDHILHAGDIGMPAILLRLEEIAPVTAVCGNTDDPGFGYRLSEVIELAGHKFLLHHIVNPHQPGDTLKSLVHRHRPDVVVFGHTHRPFNQVIGHTLFFNPGYAGKQRFALERSVAVLHCDKGNLRPEFCTLP